MASLMLPSAAAVWMADPARPRPRSSSIPGPVIRIRSALTARRPTLAALGVVVALGLVITVAHGSPGGGHMDGMADDQGGHSDVATMCLAIVEAGGAGVALLALWSAVRRRPVEGPRPSVFLTSSRLPHAPPAPLARAGPAVLQVYRL